MKVLITLCLSVLLGLVLAVAPWIVEDSQAAITTPSGSAPYTVPASAIGVSGGSAQDVSDDLLQARELLKRFQHEYRYLEGVTIEVGSVPGDHQAVAYYRDGRIVISPTRYSSLETIVAHEIWHIIDWRDTGSIEWDEDVPPANWTEYLKDARQ